MMHFFYKRLCKDLLGIVFCLSAVFKMMDSVGTGLIMESYFNFFHLWFLVPAAKVCGIILSLTEGAIAVGLLTGVFKRFFAYATCVMVGFFTIVTLILWIANPSMDCGCFGEFIHLTHLQSLIKNLILCALAAVSFIPIYSYEVMPGHSVFAFVVSYLLMAYFALGSLNQVPLFDFTAFAPSHTIVSAEDATGDDEYPTLMLWDEEGIDHSEEILNGKVVLISFYHPDAAENEDVQRTHQFIEEAYNAGITPVVLTSGNLDIDGAAPQYFADYKDLITLNRSNGGVTFLSDGYIISKISADYMLEDADMAQLANSDPTEAYINTATWRTLTLQGILLVFFAVILLF